MTMSRSYESWLVSRSYESWLCHGHTNHGLFYDGHTNRDYVTVIHLWCISWCRCLTVFFIRRCVQNSPFIAYLYLLLCTQQRSSLFSKIPISYLNPPIFMNMYQLIIDNSLYFLIHYLINYSWNFLIHYLINYSWNFLIHYLINYSWNFLIHYLMNFF